MHELRKPTMTADLFDLPSPVDWHFSPDRDRESLAPGACILRGVAASAAPELLAEIARIGIAAPFRHLITPGGRRMSVAMTNCGRLGWVSDTRGYRYTQNDPLTGHPWPQLPDAFAKLASQAATYAGYELPGTPDACLINRYETGARLTLHQDRDELNLQAPIISVSLGVAAIFVFGGTNRSGPTRRVRLSHGDVVVWGGESRLAYHGVMPLAADQHPATGSLRYNLTFRTVK